MQVSMSLLLYIEGKPFGEKPSNLHMDPVICYVTLQEVQTL